MPSPLGGLIGSALLQPFMKARAHLLSAFTLARLGGPRAAKEAFAWLPTIFSGLNYILLVVWQEGRWAQNTLRSFKSHSTSLAPALAFES